MLSLSVPIIQYIDIYNLLAADFLIIIISFLIIKEIYAVIKILQKINKSYLKSTNN